ncbi:uncharacterized protein N7482_006295 [Penicillium canariense]|uniref:Tyrosine--tRNA ligase n=1 Tax=Penicillium canariense TaxID=189055 RepID=A0A9W9LN33_9EURO|nr:uncharacterized protein N7482_006295 [Penicillium canariense]KAJ5167514.1 hypothetical protein N7482_006295 [Penicillium canariense]
MALTKEERLALINENLAEVLNPEIIEDVLDRGETLKIYWGTATTASLFREWLSLNADGLMRLEANSGLSAPHPLQIMKIAQFLQAGAAVKVLLADVHAFLDNLKAPIELVEERAKYYRFCITALLRAVNVPVEKLEFVQGSSYQLTPKYTMDVYKLCSITSSHDARKAGAEVVKQTDNPPISGLIYPLLQAIDEEYLGVHAQFGGVDQRKIFALAKDVLPRLGYKERAHLMNPLVPSLSAGKMSSSEPNSKIDLLDTPDVVARKVKKANAAPKQVHENGLISFVEYVLLPASELLDGERCFKVEKDGETLVYKDIEALKKDYEADVLSPQALKPAVTESLNRLLAPIQAEYQASQEWQETTKKAYPAEQPKEKKVKKVKDRGNRRPAVKPEEKGATEEKGTTNAMENLSVN